MEHSFGCELCKKINIFFYSVWFSFSFLNYVCYELQFEKLMAYHCAHGTCGKYHVYKYIYICAHTQTKSSSDSNTHTHTHTERQVLSNIHTSTHTHTQTIGRTSLSLALGNMVVARQILLVFNLSYLPFSVQFVNKNYCHAKKTIFLRPVDAIILCVNDLLWVWKSFNVHTKRSETERGSDVESQMSEVGKRLCSENHSELLQEERTDMKL